MVSRLKTAGYSFIALATFFAGAQAGMGAEFYWAGTTSDWSATKINGMSTTSLSWNVYKNGKFQNPTARSENDVLPGSQDTVIFQVNDQVTSHDVTFGSISSAPNVEIYSIQFNDSATTPLTIQSLTNGALIIDAIDTIGLSVSSGSAAHTIASNVTIKFPHTWDIASPTTPNANTLTVSGILSSQSVGNIPFVKTGGGTLVLSGKNMYSFGTDIQNGTLRLEKPAGNGINSQTGTGNVLVESAGTLSGTGTASGEITLYGTLQPGGTSAAGNPTLGILTTGTQHWFDSAQMDIHLQDLLENSSMGVGWDGLQVNGDVDFDPLGHFVINVQSLSQDTAIGGLDGLDLTHPVSWKILSLTGQITNFDSDRFSVNTQGFANNLDGTSFSLRADENAIYLEFAPIPEPGSLMLLSLTSALLLNRRRRIQVNLPRPADQSC